VILGIAFVLPCGAQMLKYDNEEEIYGAAATSPGAVMQVVRKLISFCEDYDSNLRASGEAEMNRWTERHAAYLVIHRKVRQQVLAAMNDPRQPATERDAIKNMFEKVEPQAIQSQFESFAAPIRAMTSPAMRIGMCKSYLKAIDDGEFDLKRNDPTLAAWFDKQIADRH